MFECVINVSEGRDQAAIEDIRIAGGAHVLDVHSDIDHNRTVYTVASRTLSDVYDTACAVVTRSYDLLDFTNHLGVHPCLGVVDVVPFVSYDNENMVPSQETIDAALAFAQWAHTTFDIPVFTYDRAHPRTQRLPDIRRHAFHEVHPAYGTEKHARFGALCVGARRPLIAINVNLLTEDIFVVKHIAKSIRESSGGIFGVRAIGLELAHAKRMQVSMNIVTPHKTNAGEVCLDVMSRAERSNIGSEVELVGLVPHFQYALWSEEFLERSGLNEHVTVEARVIS